MLPLAIVLLALAVVAAIVFATAALQRGRRLQATERAIVELAGSWSEDGSSRGRMCAAARQVTGADVAFLTEPTRRGDALSVTATAAAGTAAGALIALDAERSLLARAFWRGEAIHVVEADATPEAADAARLVRARSLHLMPVRRGDRVIGVLVLGWARRRRSLASARCDLLRLVANEASRAIERDAHVALLARQARTDELTALPNRRAWDEALEREMSRAERTEQPLCVALLDLDHFKAYNDQFGHQAGDAHLRRTAALWRRELRTVDVLARYGGEEFGVLLPDCDLDQAREVLDRVRSSTPNGQTASAGVVQFDSVESAADLLARADQALYAAKHAGRGQTVPA